MPKSQYLKEINKIYVELEKMEAMAEALHDKLRTVLVGMDDLPLKPEEIEEDDNG